jgi:hypothetical protein
MNEEKKKHTFLSDTFPICKKMKGNYLKNVTKNSMSSALDKNVSWKFRLLYPEENSVVSFGYRDG